MCGLVGMVGNLYKPDVDVFNELLYCDFLRGKHATGVASVNGKQVRLLKKPWDPLSLMCHKSYDSVVNMQADVLIGHNRHGTFGDNSNPNNAHPFLFENVVGAHNGTLTRSCVPKLHNADQYGTDSEALYSEINTNGIDTAFTKIGGAWALTFFDRRNGTINLIANDQRPLSFAYKKGRGALYWASESDLLYYILGRNKIEIENDTVYRLPVDELWSWKVGRTIAEPETRPLAASWKEPTYMSTTTGWWDRETKTWHTGERPRDNTPPFVPKTISTGKTTTTPGTALAVVVDNTTSEDQPFKMPYRDGLGQVIGKQRFDKIIENNCCLYCGNDSVEWGKPAMFLKSQTRGYCDFVCTECYSDPEKRDLVKAC